MEKVDKSKIVAEIANINKYIEEFELERKTGTKALKQKFHKNKVAERNIYVKEQIEHLTEYKNKIFEELKRRVNVLLPSNRNEYFTQEENKLESLKDLLIYSNKYMSDNFKIGLYDLTSKLVKNVSFDLLNDTIDKFISSFRAMNINLTIKDFSYTMYLKEYFETYFKTTDEVDRKEKFESIYWECPNLVDEIRSNMFNIISRYKKEINIYTTNKLNDLLKENKIELSNLDEIYRLTREKYEDEMESDEYLLLQSFITGQYKIDDYLKGSAVRDKIYNTFVFSGKYDDLPVEEKIKYRDSMKDLYKTLKYLKTYYQYEFIVKDLIDKYLKKDSAKNDYLSAVKDLQADNKEREKINADYIKASGVGLFAKNDENKKTLLKVKMNEAFSKLNEDFGRYNEIKISYNLLDNVRDSSNIHELLMTALTSYNYLVSKIDEMNVENLSYDLEEEIDNYIKFLYDSNGDFIEGIFMSNSESIAEIISNKFKLLNIKIEKEQISKDAIDAILSDIGFINNVQNIENNRLSLENIKFICSINAIEPVKLKEEII